jgi:hypothetical protein
MIAANHDAIGEHIEVVIIPFAGRTAGRGALEEQRGHRRQRSLPQSSSASRFTAGASAFFILSQSGDRPERYVESLRFDTMPSMPSLQTCRTPKARTPLDERGSA